MDRGVVLAREIPTLRLFLFYSILFLLLLLSRCFVSRHINLNLIPDGFNGSIHLEIMNP